MNDLKKFDLPFLYDSSSIAPVDNLRETISSHVRGCLNMTRKLLELEISLGLLESKFAGIKNLKGEVANFCLNGENKKCLMKSDNFVLLIDNGITYVIGEGGNGTLQARCFKVMEQNPENKIELNDGKLVVYDMINNKGTDNSIETENVNNITLDNIIDKIVEAINEIIDKSEKVEISKDRLS